MAYFKLSAHFFGVFRWTGGQLKLNMMQNNKDGSRESSVNCVSPISYMSESWAVESAGVYEEVGLGMGPVVP